LAYDERTAENILAQASALYPLETVCFELLQKGLTYLGEGWFKGEVTVQQEHFASALAMRRLDALVAAAPPPTRPGRILVACSPAEEHTFSPLLITLLLRRHSWNVLYLGADVPLNRLEMTTATTRPQLVIVSAQQLHTAATLLEMAELLQRENVPLAFGGAIFNVLPPLRFRIPGYFLGERLDLTPQIVEQLLMSPRLAPPPLVNETSEQYQEALHHFRERQSLLEAYVWQLMKAEKISQEHLAQANNKLGRDIVAALMLGNIAYVGSDITWIETLLINYQLDTEQLRRYLKAYYQAAQLNLEEPGGIIVEWLARLTGEAVSH
jgi:methanogenic corrinoid protein MtbC1